MYPLGHSNRCENKKKETTVREVEEGGRGRGKQGEGWSGKRAINVLCERLLFRCLIFSKLRVVSVNWL